MSKFKTFEQTIGYVFGGGIKEFEEGHFPSEFDVARRLIALIDENRKTLRFSPAAAISNLAKELVSFWEIHSSLEIKSEKAIGKNIITMFYKQHSDSNFQNRLLILVALIPIF